MIWSLFRRVPLSFLLLLISQHALACLVLFCSDGTRVLAGNHEDWFASEAEMRVIAPGESRYGSVIFTFRGEGWAQGGMNVHGLFFDATSTPETELEQDPMKKVFAGYLWQEILDKATTVAEALVIIKQYHLPELQSSHIILGDATGHAVLIGVKDGKMEVNDVINGCLLQTNFNPWHPELSDEPLCERYQAASAHLSQTPEVSVENFRSVLQKTHQGNLTVYSNVYDLTKKTIYTYPNRDFDNPIIVSLPDIFSKGNCSLSLLPGGKWSCNTTADDIAVRGKITDEKGQPVQFANIGIPGKNIGTLSDPDGTFELRIPPSSLNDTIYFSTVGLASLSKRVADLAGRRSVITLPPSPVLLDEIEITARRKTKQARLGWMGGRDGVLPFDTIQGGGAVALLVEAPSVPYFIEKLQVRLMYNSKDTLVLRFHIYEHDSVLNRPGEELLSKEVMLYENKRFGWLRFDLSEHKIALTAKRICVAFEWIDDRRTREELLAGLKEWERWKKEEYLKGNERVSVSKSGSSEMYKYKGNMMDWSGFSKLPPFTGLMVESGKNEKTQHLKTFERKTSFGEWTELPSTLNAVITVSY